MARRRKKKRKINLKVLIALIIIIGVTAGLLTAPIFNISKISVSGIERLTEEQVISVSGIGLGKNIFRTSIGRARKKIMSQPMVENVKILRKFPARIEISVEERKLFAYVPFGDVYYGIDKNCTVIETVTECAEDSPKLTGLYTLEAPEGGEIKFQNDGETELVKKIAGALYENGMGDVISELNLQNTVNIMLVTKSGLIVQLADDSELDYKIKLMKNIIDRGYTWGVFDVSNPAVPTYRKNM